MVITWPFWSRTFRKLFVLFIFNTNFWDPSKRIHTRIMLRHLIIHNILNNYCIVFFFFFSGNCIHESGFSLFLVICWTSTGLDTIWNSLLFIFPHRLPLTSKRPRVCRLVKPLPTIQHLSKKKKKQNIITFNRI